MIKLNIAGEERGIPRAGLIRELGENARAELGKLIEGLFDENIIGLIAVRQGEADEEIVNEALATNAAMIIMGANNHAGLFRLLQRDTVKWVIRHAPCPVLVVRVGHASRCLTLPVARSESRSDEKGREAPDLWLQPARFSEA